MPEELWTKVGNTVQEVVNKTIANKRKCNKAIWLSEEALQIAEKRREVKVKGEKIYQSECRVPKIRKSFFFVVHNAKI